MLHVNGWYVAKGVSHLYLLPHVHSTTGLLKPVTGDADLYLTLDGMSWLVAQSLNWYVQWDTVHYQSSTPRWPWKVFRPYYKVHGYQASVYGFSYSGFRLG